MVKYIRSDLEFILAQILIAERHAAGEKLSDMLPNGEVALGLRTVDGSGNNLARDRLEFGAADNSFPRMTDPVFLIADPVPPGFGPPGTTSYQQTSGNVFDADPRIISNLIVDQSANNPAAYARAYDLGADGLPGGTGEDADTLKEGVSIVNSPGPDLIFGTSDDRPTFQFDNVAPDEGLSAPFNSWMTFFGQFFDHGLDLVTKGGSGTIFIPLQPDDPLFNPAPGAPNFLIVTRATNRPGPDGKLGTADDIHEHENTTSSFVDQNQTYSSHPSHQVFLRAYRLNNAGDPVATGDLITNRNLVDGVFGNGDDVEIGGMATWAVVKAQARDYLGINLTDANLFNIPLLATDAYGNFIRGPNGMPQVVIRTGNGDDGIAGTADDTTILVEGNRAAPINLANAVGTGHAFLNDIAHLADPSGGKTPDAGTSIGNDDGLANTYDNELLDAHYIAGDGRVNENIGLITVHHVFHAEHNRLAQHTKDVVLETNDLEFLTSWLMPGTAPASFPTTAGEIANLQWNGERIFQAAKFGTEMQYQHLVFEEFARTIQVNVDAFLDYNDTIDPSIFAEFAHTVYRFGHSMLTETIDRLDANFVSSEIGLVEAFLNPLAFANGGATPEEAAGAIIRGVTRQVGNEIDEFVTEALRNNLLGLPLDLAAINIARGRDTGIPSLNAARREFYNGTGDSQLKPYISWVDFVQHIKNPESLVNFIAAYGTHAAQVAADVNTVAEKRAVAAALVFGGSAIINQGTLAERTFTANEADRLAFLNSEGIYANLANGVTRTGVDNIDLWMGGLAEEKMPFGGMLGSTFNFVFETQMEALQDGDRFYYLHRLAGLNFFTELEQNSFASILQKNAGVNHLPSLAFVTPGFTLEVNQAAQFNSGLNGADPTNDDPLIPLVIRDNPGTVGTDTNYVQFTGGDHVVLGGTAGNDILVSSIGDDTLYGDGGNDRLEGGYGNDDLQGGDGDDIITDVGGDDVIKGGAGNDVIQGGQGLNLIIAGDGNDFIITGEDSSETFAGAGNDFILGSKMNIQTLGQEGDDWIEIGTQDGAFGDNVNPLADDAVIGNDVFLGDGSYDEMLGEGGDDITVGSGGPDKHIGGSGFDWATFKDDRFGVSIDMITNAFAGAPVPVSGAAVMNKFAEVEGLSGSSHSDILRGDLENALSLPLAGTTGSVLRNIALVNGLQTLLNQTLGDGATFFDGGNILLGGDGSDVIEGRGGDDIIHGDKWLNVRVSVRDPLNHAIEIDSVDRIADLVPRMLSGEINPGQLEIVREIKNGAFNSFNFDTAVFSGNTGDYDVLIDDRGTANTSDDLVRVRDLVVGRDGTDLLVGIERLQFNDGAATLVEGLNAGPDGFVTISDDTPTGGQVLTVSMLGVTDADNTLAGGVISGPVSVYWQAETLAGTGIFIDILPALGGAPIASPTLAVDGALTGLALRARVVYQDQHGVLEMAFSAATSAVVAGPPPAPPAPPADMAVSAPSTSIRFIRSDLEFILDQISFAERHASGEDLGNILPNGRVPFGLRTVDGSFNNLAPGQTAEFGGADQNFPRMTDPVFNPADPVPPGFGPPGTTSYAQTSGNVFDSAPRTISNLIVDQSAANPAAYARAHDLGADGLPGGAGADADTLKEGVSIVNSPGPDLVFGTGDDRPTFQFDNVAPDEGLSAPFNSWMTFFGQFFDHGLDLLTKGGSGTIFVPLQPDDPLFNTAPGAPNFLIVTRATNRPGPDGKLGTADDIHEHENTTSSFVDQNQTYSSHPAHQVFLRAYEFNDAGEPVATGGLITNRNLVDGIFGNGDDIEIGGMATWAVVKAQARDILGINLTDANTFNVPLLATDAYGNFIKGPSGFPQVVMNNGAGGTILVEGNPAAPINLANAVGTGHAFMNDIAHHADPGTTRTPDLDSLLDNNDGVASTYDNELLDAHYIAGDGRVNENIGLITVHHVFHGEHNRLVEHTKNVILATGDAAFIAEWQMPDGSWNGERLFQAAKFGTEMQYQHLVFEEFARTMQPQIDLFMGPNQNYDAFIDPAIVAEFAHTVYRFGHSMLTETIDRLDPDFNSTEIGLVESFLNPLAFANGGTPEEAAGAIVRGVTRQVGNEIDEFVTEALRNNLLGLPLDLPAINIARGRDTGIPSLNACRRDFYNMTGDSQLKPYTSWSDFVQYIKHPESLLNFIAAYGTHAALLATDVNTLAEMRAVAAALVFGGSAVINQGTATERTFTADDADRLAFLNSQGAYANLANGVTTTGVDDIDLWMGGLAEEKMPFGGMLGSTFNFVFETQMEALQNADRFYYLDRTIGLNFVTELESNTFARMIAANTDATHLPGNVFLTPGFILESNQANQFNAGLGSADPTNGDPLLPLVIRNNPNTIGPDANYVHYTGDDHVVLGGTAGRDFLIASIGDDTLYGDAGNDVLEGGYGNDMIFGGAGHDIMTDIGGDDNMQGGDGNDVIHGGNGINLIIAGPGKDFIVTGEDSNESFGGAGDDFILGTTADEQNMGNEGDDWIESGSSDGSPGDNFDPNGLDLIAGNDIYIGDGFPNIMNAEGGDDIMVGSAGPTDRFLGASGFDWATFKDERFGTNTDLLLSAFDVAPTPASNANILARFAQIEGLSGSAHGDILRGDDQTAATLAIAGSQGSILTNIALINGLQTLLDSTLGAGTTMFDGGNIILGGDGSDIIEGRGGDDIIDGDKWLNVRVSVRQNIDGTGPEIRTVDSLRDLVPDMMSGAINPGQLVAVREILTAAGPDFDTVLFTGNRIGYDVNVDDGGTAADFTDDVVTVTDSVAGRDGADRLMNVEQLRFADQVVILRPGLNAAPVGTLTLRDATTNAIDNTPTENQRLRVSMAGITDADNVTAANPTGTITGDVSYYWQSELVPGSGIFTDIIAFAAGEAGRTTGPLFTPGDAEVGLRLRVRSVYEDRNGVLEQVFSAPTATVINVNDTPVGNVLVSDSTPTEGRILTANNAFTDADGLAGAVFTYQWQQSGNLGGGGGWDDIDGAVASIFVPDQSHVNRQLRVIISYTDFQGTNQTLTSAGTIVTGDFIGPNDNGQTLNGNAGQDMIFGGAGDDTINGNDQDDTLNGGEGNDTINAGAGNDIINYEFGDNADAVNGGTGLDTINVTGLNGANTLDVIFNGTAITLLEGGAVSSVEAVTADLLTGIDTLSYIGTTAAISVNLALYQASGFTTIVNIENVVGGTGADSFRGDAAENTFNGAGGTDIFYAAAGDGNDAISGDAGVDTYDMSATSAGLTITTATASSADIGNDTLNSIENIIAGQGADNILLNGGANLVDGQGGADTINAGAGNDIVRGGGGNDTINYVVGQGTDTVDGGADFDTLATVGTAAGDTLDVVFNGAKITNLAGGGAISNVERFTVDLLAGTDTLSYAGTAAAVNVTVNLTTGVASGFNLIANVEDATGGAGNDTLTGRVGVTNTLTGGNGNDIFVVHDTADVVSEANGTAGGVDQVNSIANVYTIADADVENLTFTGAGNFTGTGNAAVNVITGGAGNDILTGGGANDTINGLAGNDIFNYTAGDGADTVNGGADNDTVNIIGAAGNANDTVGVVFNGTVISSIGGGGVFNSIEAFTIDLGANTGAGDTLSYAGTTAVVTVNLTTGVASGFASIANVENVTGGAGADTLTGVAGIINAMTGGHGNDIFVVHDTGDTVSEGNGGASGVDQVNSLANVFAITDADVENLTFIGAGDFTGTGNASANVITGGAGNDTLAGLGGADTLNGLGGNDIFNYTIGGGADTVDGGADSDTLNITGTNGGNTLDAVFNGTVLTNFEGGSITGVEAVSANLLAGNDTLNYSGTTAGVTVNLGAGTASGFTSITSIENVIGGAGVDNLTGTAGINNAMTGGNGNDIFVVHDTGDTVREANGNAGGIDTVNSMANVFTINDADVENLIFIGAGNFNGTGNASNNRLAGATGNDTLNGGAGNDTFFFRTGFGQDTIAGFDSNPAGGQDNIRLDLSLGINAGNFNANVSIAAVGADTRVTIGANTITLLGVAAATVDVNDFSFGA